MSVGPADVASLKVSNSFESRSKNECRPIKVKGSTCMMISNISPLENNINSYFTSTIVFAKSYNKSMYNSEHF